MVRRGKGEGVRRFMYPCLNVSETVRSESIWRQAGMTVRGQQQLFCAAPHGFAPLPPARPRITISPIHSQRGAVNGGREGGRAEEEEEEEKGDVQGLEERKEVCGGVQVKPAFILSN